MATTTSRRRIRYRHPNAKGDARIGYIVTSGRDGHEVERADTGERERVRHEDVLGEMHSVIDRRDRPESDDDWVEDDDLEKSIAAMLGQDALRQRAHRFADQYVSGHPAHVHPDDLDWKLDTSFPLKYLPGTKDEWLDWHKATHAARNLDYAKQPHHQRVLSPAVVVHGTDGKHYIWDGNRRVAEMHAAGKDSIPALVGEPKNQDRPLPPGSEGRSGIRKAIYARQPLPIILKATDAFAKLRQRTAAKQVMSRLQSNARAGQPGAGATGRDRNRRENARHGGGGKGQQGTEWQLPHQPRPQHDVGHMVHYQTPFMHQPEMGRVESVGKHGAIVSNHEGAQRKVRHEHVLGSATEGLPPDWRQSGAEALRGQGAPIDPLEQYLLPDRQERPAKLTMDRLKELASDGAPIDMERIAHAPERDARKVIERFTGKIDHGDTSAKPVVRRNQAGGAKLGNPYRMREDA